MFCGEECRREAEDEPGYYGDAQTPPEHRWFEAHTSKIVQLRGREFNDQVKPAPSEQKASGAASERQQHTLSKHQSDEPSASGTQRSAYGEFALAAAGAHEKQIGDVSAGDEQHQTDRSKQHYQRASITVAEEVFSRPHQRGANVVASGRNAGCRRRNCGQLLCGIAR